MVVPPWIAWAGALQMFHAALQSFSHCVFAAPPRLPQPARQSLALRVQHTVDTVPSARVQAERQLPPLSCEMGSARAAPMPVMAASEKAPSAMAMLVRLLMIPSLASACGPHVGFTTWSIALTTP